MKKLSYLLASTLLAGTVLASGSPEVKLQGVFDFQASLRNQKNLESDNHLTANQKNNAFKTKAAVTVKVSNTTDSGLLYGANINLNTTTSADLQHGSHLFVEADYGRVEAGARIAAQNVMSVSAYSIAAACGDCWVGYANLNPAIYQDKGAYNADFSDYSLVYIGYGGTAEQVRNITYYTPKISGFQLGLSYSPDTTNVGSGDVKVKPESINYFDKTGVVNEVTRSVKNLLGAGLTFEHNLSDGVDLKLGAGYEQGKYDARNAQSNEKVKFADHKLYNFGASLTYGSWSIAGSYANAGKSGTNPVFQFDKKQNILYTGGIAYRTGPFGLSFTYLHNDRLSNKLNSYTLGTDYKLAPGFMPYAELTSFNFKNKGYDLTSGTPVQINKKLNGMVYTLGAKVTF